MRKHERPQSAKARNLANMFSHRYENAEGWNEWRGEGGVIYQVNSSGKSLASI